MNKRGSVLMIGLWILAILVVFALGLGHRASINLRLTRYQRDRLKATCLAKAGINRAIAELEKDAKETTYDSLTEAWSTGKDSQGNLIFNNLKIEEDSVGTFTIKNIYDEGSRININEIDTIEKEQILIKLFESGGIENQGELEELKTLFLKWIGKTPLPEEEAKQEIIKNKPLKCPEEMLVILEYFYEPKEGPDKYRRKAQEVFNKIKNLITVYPKGININTASREVLRIIAESVSNDVSLVDGVTDKIIAYRDSPDGPFKDLGDTSKFENTLSVNEQAIFSGSDVSMKRYLTVQSNNFRIESHGNVGQVTKTITVIYDREGEKIVYWHEN